MYVEQLTQGLGFGTPIHAGSLAAGTYNSGSVDLQTFRRALFVLDVGTVTTGTAALQLQESADNATWSNCAFPGTWNTTPITTSGQVASVEIRADQLSAGKRYVRAQLTIATAATPACVLALGYDAAHKPGSLKNDASVGQQLTNP